MAFHRGREYCDIGEYKVIGKERNITDVVSVRSEILQI